MSGTSVASLEDAARSSAISLALIRRAQAAAVQVLVVTIDLPVEAKRERDIRNGFVLPPSVTQGPRSGAASELDRGVPSNRRTTGNAELVALFAGGRFRHAGGGICQ
jgi:hypothetical protein